MKNAIDFYGGHDLRPSLHSKTPNRISERASLTLTSGAPVASTTVSTQANTNRYSGVVSVEKSFGDGGVGLTGSAVPSASFHASNIFAVVILVRRVVRRVLAAKMIVEKLSASAPARGAVMIPVCAQSGALAATAGIRTG
jgi:hypothetical protein